MKTTVHTERITLKGEEAGVVLEGPPARRGRTTFEASFKMDPSVDVHQLELLVMPVVDRVM